MKLQEFIERIESDATTGGREQLRLLQTEYLNTAIRAVVSRTKKPYVNGRLVFVGDTVMGHEQGDLVVVGRVWAVKSGRRVDLAYLADDDGMMDTPASTVSSSDRLFWRLGRENTTDGIFIYRHTDEGLELISSLTTPIDSFEVGCEGVVSPVLINASDAIPLPSTTIIGPLTLAVKSMLAYDMGQLERGATLWQLFERATSEDNIDMKGYRQVRPDTHMMRRR